MNWEESQLSLLRKEQFAAHAQDLLRQEREVRANKALKEQAETNTQRIKPQAPETKDGPTWRKKTDAKFTPGDVRNYPPHTVRNTNNN
jgi:hypothetical protein